MAHTNICSSLTVKSLISNGLAAPVLRMLSAPARGKVTAPCHSCLFLSLACLDRRVTHRYSNFSGAARLSLCSSCCLALLGSLGSVCINELRVAECIMITMRMRCAQVSDHILLVLAIATTWPYSSPPLDAFPSLVSFVEHSHPSFSRNLYLTPVCL